MTSGVDSIGRPYHLSHPPLQGVLNWIICRKALKWWKRKSNRVNFPILGVELSSRDLQPFRNICKLDKVRVPMRSTKRRRYEWRQCVYLSRIYVHVGSTMLNLRISTIFHRFLYVSSMLCILWSLGYLLSSTGCSPSHLQRNIFPADERSKVSMSDCKNSHLLPSHQQTQVSFLATCILRGPCLALEKVKLYQIKPTQSHVCFFSKKITKIKSSTQLVVLHHLGQMVKMNGINGIFYLRLNKGDKWHWPNEQCSGILRYLKMLRYLKKTTKESVLKVNFVPFYIQ